MAVTGRGACTALACWPILAAMVGARGPAPDVQTIVDTQAVQLATASADTAAAAAAMARHRAGYWVPGQPYQNECPSGAVPISQDECEAFAMMDKNPGLFSQLSTQAYQMLREDFPFSSATYPKGCSIIFMGFFRAFYFNTHPTGAVHPMAIVACKDDSWTMYKSKCPDGMVTVSAAECIDFSNDKHHFVHSGSQSMPDYPPGCFGHGGGYPPPGHTDAGKVFFNTHPTGNLANPDAYPVCKLAPSSAPSPVPTGSPSPPGGSGGGTTSATGDPHMTTISGVRFDIMRTGAHALLQIPQAAVPADTLLRVQAIVEHEGAKCEDMYIKVLNVTGSWAEERRFGGFSFVTELPSGDQVVASPVGGAEWAHLGMVDLKVVRGRTRSGVLYLNMFARHLRDASKRYPVGGILGLDDHTEAATPAAGCRQKVLSLLSSSEPGDLASRSVAEAIL